MGGVSDGVSDIMGGVSDIMGGVSDIRLYAWIIL